MIFKATDAAHLHWIADRLIKVHKTSPNIDFIRALREIADKVDEAYQAQGQAPARPTERVVGKSPLFEAPYGADLGPCKRPPKGWYCTQPEGHLGPCRGYRAERNFFSRLLGRLR